MVAEKSPNTNGPVVVLASRSARFRHGSPLRATFDHEPRRLTPRPLIFWTGTGLALWRRKTVPRSDAGAALPRPDSSYAPRGCAGRTRPGVGRRHALPRPGGDQMFTQEPVVLITGASRGLGLEIARLFARIGSPLVLTARGDAALRTAADELSQRTDVVAIAGDVANPAHVERLISTGEERFGWIDALINNASTIGSSP